MRVRDERHARPWAWLLRGTTGRDLLLGRFTGLTVVLVVIFFAAAISERSRVHVVMIDIGLSAMLGLSIWTVGPRLRVLAWALALPTFLGQWALTVTAPVAAQQAVLAMTTLFLGFVAVVVLGEVLADEAVTVDTIMGAVAVYFLLGLIFGCAYAWVAIGNPAAFSISAALQEHAGSEDRFSPLPPLMQYYSFVTLSTVGFGDITPVSPVVRSLSMIEAFTGQLYLAVLVARLVGIHGARSRSGQ